MRPAAKGKTLHETRSMTTTRIEFRTNLFHSGEPRPNWPDPAAHGEDLAEWLRARLQAEDFELSKPRWDDRAWCMECPCGGETHFITVQRAHHDAWILHVQRARSWIATLISEGPGEDAGLIDAIRSALLREPAVSGLHVQGRSVSTGELSVG